MNFDFCRTIQNSRAKNQAGVAGEKELSGETLVEVQYMKSLSLANVFKDHVVFMHF